MGYYESAEGLRITRQRAFQELKAHGLDGEWEYFIKDLGLHEWYDAQDVLVWLGY